ncbi:caveolin-3-like [Amphiura filiformis]|uniref:caveolin-3-like n=1 Tax=Amphiura filiformis TaxID=82378 RepID=UPI003B223D8A
MAETKVEEMPVELDMNDRDPNELNEHVKNSWPELFGEPEGVYSFERIWMCSYKTYFYTKLWCYKIISAICAVPAAFCWGVYFACMSFMYIWYLTPCVKAYLVQLNFASNLFQVCLKSFCNPLWESCALIFSKFGAGGGGGDSKA